MSTRSRKNTIRKRKKADRKRLNKMGRAVFYPLYPFYPLYLDYHHPRMTPMQISIVHEDGTENEFEIPICCPDCSRGRGWSEMQHTKIYGAATNGETIKVPDYVHNEEQFIQYVKSL